MIELRPFSNSDTPHLAEIWRSRNQERGRMQPMSAIWLELLVFAKPYFDREGLIVAVDQDRPIGFVHVGFGPSPDRSTLSTEVGVTCMLMVQPEYRRAGIGRKLLEAGEDYLRRRGATTLYGGGVRPYHPFYLGLYGGSELPGVLTSDAEALQLYRAAGYQEVGQVQVLQKELAGFRPPVDRKQMQLRRQSEVRVVVDPPSASWWEACTMGCLDRVRYELYNPPQPEPAAWLTLWSMEPISNTWGVQARGLIDLEVIPSRRRQGLATFLLSEACKQLQSQGIALVEAQAKADDEASLGLLQKLDFRSIDQGLIFRKPA